MSMSTGSATMTTTGNSSAVQKNPLENYETITVIPTTGATAYTGLSFTVEGSIDGTNYEKLPVLDNKSGLLIAGGTSISPTDESTHSYSMMFANNYTSFRVNVSAITTGSATFLMNGSQTSPGQALYTTVAGGAGAFTNLTASGTLGVTGATTLSSTLAVTGATTLSSTLALTGNLAIATSKFTVAAASGNTVSAGSILSSSASGGIGYTTGAGGTVTQGSSRTTTVVCNAPTGAITLVSAAGSATPFTFQVTNSAVAATDTVVVSQKSGTDAYSCVVTTVAAGSFKITVTDLTGTTTEQPVINFAVIKGITS